MQVVKDHFNNWDDDRIRLILADRISPSRPSHSFADAGEITFRPASPSEIARWAAAVTIEEARRGECFACNTMTFLVPHLPCDLVQKPEELSLH